MKTIIFSGTFAGHERKDLEKQAQDAGFKLAASVNKSVNYLVAGHKIGPAKLDQATKLGVAIIKLEDFFAMLNPDQPKADFFAQMPAPEAEVAVWTAYLESLDWEKFKPTEEGGRLREALTLHQKTHGISPAHKLASQKVAKHLQLFNAFAHEDEAEFWELSPNGEWLAVGSWMNEDYVGYAQIWETRTGRVVNAFRVRGGVGWPDYKAFEWSPDSSLLASTFDTNGVGVWKPFERNSSSPYLYAYITDGWSRPPYFTWYPDGKSIFIKCPIFDGFDRKIFQDEYGEEDGAALDAYCDDDSNGAEMPVYQRLGDMRKAVKAAKRPVNTVSAKKSNSKAPANLSKLKPTSLANGNWLVHTAQSISFYDAQGERYAHFEEVSPTHNSPYVWRGKDSGLQNGCVGILHEGAEIWLTPFGYGVQTGFHAPKEVNLAQHFNYSLGCKWAWDLDWVDYKRGETFEELYNQGVHLSYELQQEITAQLPKDKKGKVLKGAKAEVSQPKPTKGQFPSTTDKTYMDLHKLAVQDLKNLHSGWSGHFCEYLYKVALAALHSETPLLALELIREFPEPNYSQYAAAIGARLLQAGHAFPEEYLPRINQHLDKIQEHSQCPTYTELAHLYYALGDMPNFEKYLQLVIEKTPTEYNQGQYAWNSLAMLWACGQKNEFQKYFKKWAPRDSPFYMDAIKAEVLKSSTADFLEFIVPMLKKMDTWNFLELMVEKIDHDNAYDHLEAFAQIFTEHYPDYFRERAIPKMAARKYPQTAQILAPHLQDLSKSAWVNYAEIATTHFPELFQTALAANKTAFTDLFKEAYREEGKYKKLFYLGWAAGLANHTNVWEKSADALPAAYKCAYWAGLSCTLPAADAEALLEKLWAIFPVSKSQDNPEKRQQIEAYERLELFKFCLKAAYKLGTDHKTYLQILAAAQAHAIERNKDLDLAALVDFLSEIGDMQNAYKSWKKIPKGKQHYRIGGLLKLAARQKDCNALYELIYPMTANDLNDRPKQAVYALLALTGAAKVNF